MHHSGTTPRRHRRPGRRGFTVVELLVVIGVIILLSVLVAGAATVVFRQQKQATTRTVLHNLKLAIEQFQQADPLRGKYNLRDRATFGALPPLMLANNGVTGSIANLMDRSATGPADPESPPYLPQSYVLENRLHWDMGNRDGNVINWVNIASSSDANQRRNDDNRGLYVYLRKYAEKSLSQVGDAFQKPLVTGRPEYFNPTGAGTAANSPGKLDVLGFVDAWGVPLDYTIYVKVEWGLRQTALGPTAGFRIVDRQAVVRSRGIDREKYDAFLSNPTGYPADDSRDLWSDDLPKPYATLTNADLGILDTNGQARSNGWLRLPGVADGPTDPGGYKYRPN